MLFIPFFPNPFSATDVLSPRFPMLNTVALWFVLAMYWVLMPNSVPTSSMFFGEKYLTSLHKNMLFEREYDIFPPLYFLLISFSKFLMQS